MELAEPPPPDPNPDPPPDPNSRPVTDVRGLGPASARRLAGEGVESLQVLAALEEADIEALAHVAGLRERELHAWVASARALLEDAGGG